MRMRHVVLSSVANLALPYFSTLSCKRPDFRKKLLNETFLILRIIERDIIKHVHWSLSKIPAILVRF
jgi:hypothetical protein